MQLSTHGNISSPIPLTSDTGLAAAPRPRLPPSWALAAPPPRSVSLDLTLLA